MAETEHEMKVKDARVEAMHPSARHLMQFFAYQHLPAHLQEISRPFGELALRVAVLPPNAETTAALRKLLEAKDCAVRAVLAKE